MGKKSDFRSGIVLNAQAEKDAKRMQSVMNNALPSETISVQHALEKVTRLLETAGSSFIDAQATVEECTKTLVLCDQEVQSLQQLDVATQTVEAVVSILKNILSDPALDLSADMALPNLYAGVKLSEIVRILKGEPGDHVPIPAGEVDLF
jgi:exonuclease VII small subunit